MKYKSILLVYEWFRDVPMDWDESILIIIEKIIKWLFNFLSNLLEQWWC